MNYLKLRQTITKNRWELGAILFIFIVALGLRLWRIDEYMTFLGDEGRDVRVVRNLLRGDLVFIGPQTSIGNMYLGPLYYYMMAPALWLSQLNPVGPAIMIAILSSLTVLFTWWVGREWFDRKAGLVAALLFALSPVAIIYSRSSWNPNPMPFFALLCVYLIDRVYQFKSWRVLPIVAISLAFALQMHYLGLLLIPTLAIYWLAAVRKSPKDERKIAWRSTLVSVVLFLVLMSPLVLFDLKHDHLNFNAFKAFFSDRQTTVNINPGRSDRFLPVLYKINDDLILGTSGWNKEAIALLVFGLLIIAILRNRQQPRLVLALTWFFFGFLGLSLYKQHVYAHYFGFLFPVVYLLLGALFSFLWNGKVLGKVVATCGVLVFSWLMITKSPLRQTPNRQLARTHQAVEEIITEAGGKEFNFGLIAKQNYDESYRYFFENLKAPLVRGEDKIVDQLFVICEDGEACQPLNNPAWQIAVFGPASIAKEWRIDHLRLYKMVHTF